MGNLDAYEGQALYDAGVRLTAVRKLMDRTLLIW